ncbi:MAG: efflux RND transporter permease subunit, partial [Gammaproteobacteria bacterium]|nr:efflux RND transporter permease subunit [Gammaproteobacteria bacterium]
MNLTRLSLYNPVAVSVAALLVFLFGGLSLLELPVQMIPSVERPSIQINTGWRAAAPEEVESEIIEPQEDALRGLSGLQKMESTAQNGQGSISLTFDIDVNLQDVQLEVMNRLTRVPAYPPDATEPTVFVGRGQFGNSIAWFAITPTRDSIDITEYQDFVDEVVLPRMERVTGVSNANSFGGRAKEVRITFDPHAAAAKGVSLLDMARLTQGNTDTSGGFTDIGRRQYTLRYSGSYSLGELSNLILGYQNGSPVKLVDVASIELRKVDAFGSLNQNGGPSIAFSIEPETNVNVLDVMAGLKQATRELNDGPVGRAGLNIMQVYDETIYIEDSIAMLRNNLLLGILLAVSILWWFLRKFRATLLVALAIPISLFFAFIGLRLTGRTLNIISLAGLAFAMGMVMDSAIVVLENIVRLREKGESSEEASYQGATQVWGALLASTATTVAIFLPILFLRDIAGQLFSDLALAISIAVIISLIIAVTVIPTAANTVLRDIKLVDPHSNWWNTATAFIMRITNTAKARAVWIIALVGIGISTSII